MVKVMKEYEGRWMVWNTENGEVADIYCTDEMFMGNHSKRYTVVYRGQRVAIGLNHFQKAKSVATKHVKTVA